METAAAAAAAKSATTDGLAAVTASAMAEVWEEGAGAAGTVYVVADCSVGFAVAVAVSDVVVVVDDKDAE